jgi:hypothetical protein
MDFQPYIGVTGFMSADEVNEVLKAVPNGAKRKLMVGVLASSKTIKGIPNKWPNRYPIANKYAEIFLDHPAVLNLIHFNTKKPENLLSEMLQVTDLAGKNFHGFQLNIKWPDPNVLRIYTQRYPEKTIVLQCGQGAMEAMDYSPKDIAWRALSYKFCCDYLLIDPSGGLGKPLDSYQGLKYMEELNANVTWMRFGIAGGLSPETLGLVEPIIKKFPNICIDAEGRLRDENDHLVAKRAMEFVSKAYELFSHYEK